MQPNIFVINLERSIDRRLKIQKRLNELEVQFSFINAVDGRSLSNEEKSLYDDAAVNKKMHRSLSPGEIGCYLSHIKVWEKIVTEKLPWAVVLEDDIIIDDDFPQIISNIQTLPIKWDVIRLSGLCHVPTIQLLGIHTTYSVSVPLGMPSGTQGYCVSQGGARKLLAHSKPLPGTVDTSALDAFFEVGLKVMSIQPYPVKEDPLEQSLIAEDRAHIVSFSKNAAKKKGINRATYKWRRSAIKKLSYWSQLALAMKLKLWLVFKQT
jgi:glycosyl transferase family 25